VQGQHEQAAEQFRKGFQVLPEGPKAPDNLLRLGMTLDVLGRKDESCIILKQLLEKYKGRSESVLRKATRESEKLGCS
jgi:TolA-binding protein